MLVFEQVPASSTLYIPFATYGKTNGESITLTGLAVTDIEIYKDGSVTQRASDAGYTLLDTDGIDFDGITGIHGFSLDLSDNTDAGFYAVGSWYWVVVSAVTIDSQTVNFIAAVFRIVGAEDVTGYLTVGALGTTARSHVNAEVVDAISTDTYAEPTGAPAATATLAAKLNYLYMALRNKLTITASAKTFYDDSGAAEWSKSLSDDGTTYTEGEGS